MAKSLPIQYKAHNHLYGRQISFAGYMIRDGFYIKTLQGVKKAVSICVHVDFDVLEVKIF
jgi:hypothetical protein